jgi:hypothetical protein
VAVSIVDQVTVKQFNLYYPGQEDPHVGQALSLTRKPRQAESLTDFLAAVILHRDEP